ncbi:MAG: T9SS type A sorting domain-containing protein [candidate division Zixibacteria bacterium]|nr:T9SS type A sorting domain-containing protein [candidate division Zixibacteria bacterium]
MKKTILFLLLIYSAFFNTAYSQGSTDPAFHKYDTSNFPVFDNCFELYVTDGVVQNWGDEYISDFINLVLDNDTTNNSDIFPVVWNYFNPNDLDSSQAGIRFTIWDSTYTKIKYYLYDPNDAQSCNGSNPSNFCKGYGWYAGGNIFYSAIRVRYGTELLYPGDPLIMGLFAHELQHLCNQANTNYNNEWMNETKSELARFLTGYKKVNVGVFNYNIAFDNPLPWFSPGPRPTSKYWHWYLWGVYLYEQFPGLTDSIYDDLWYQYIRRESGTFSGMYSLARMFEKDEFKRYDLYGADLLREVFTNWAMANLLDDTTIEDGKYGYKNVRAKDEIGYLKINYGNPDSLQNYGYTPALHLIDTSFVNNQHNYSTIYGQDSIFVYLYSADYIKLLADPSLDNGTTYELDFQLEKEELTSTPNILLLAKAVSFDQQGKVLSVENLNRFPSGVSLSLSRFGKDVKEAIIVVCAVEDEVNEGYDWIETSRQYYNYSIELKEFTEVGNEGTIPPQKMKLDQNYPNPFNSSTVIFFCLDKEEEIKMTIYNILGQKVFTFSRNMPSGQNQIEWNAKDNSGMDLPSGIYFYNLKTKEFSETKKLILLR